MMNLRKLCIVAIALAMSGCATHQQANSTIGGITGAVLGEAVAGRAGAVAGALIGSSIGANQPTQSHRHIDNGYGSVYPDYSPCSQWRYQEREHCYRGAESRAREQQARRNREAYNAGRQGR